MCNLKDLLNVEFYVQVRNASTNDCVNKGLFTVQQIYEFECGTEIVLFETNEDAKRCWGITENLIEAGLLK